jgi:hypothetical protein
VVSENSYIEKPLIRWFPFACADLRKLPLRKYRVRAELGTRSVGDPGSRLHLLVLHQARRRLDLLPDGLSEGDHQGSLASVHVPLRYKDGPISRLRHVWNRPGCHQSDCRSPVRCGQCQCFRQCGPIAPAAGSGNLRRRVRGRAPGAARAQLDPQRGISWRSRLTSKIANAKRAISPCPNGVREVIPRRQAGAHQSIAPQPRETRNWLAAAKCPQPMNGTGPRRADRGEG